MGQVEPAPVREPANLSSEDLAAVQPRLKKGGALWRIEGNRLMLAPAGGKPMEPLQELNSQDRFILRQLDGRHSLGQIAAQLTEIYGLPADTAFDKTKTLYQCLSTHRLCDTVRS